jgi:MFS family permease
LARPEEVGAALGALRFWKPIGIVLVALIGGQVARHHPAGTILYPLIAVQGLAVVFALFINEHRHESRTPADRPRLTLPRDPGLWAFVAAMVLFHVANAPGGVYLSLFLERDLGAPREWLSYAFIVSMVAWMLVVWPAGRLADRLGRKPLLIAGWSVMALRLAIVAAARSPVQVVANQALDGLANGLFAVLAAAWVTDRLADPRRVGEAQVIVGTSLVLGSALGPAVAGFLVGPLGYRGLFALLAGVGAVATGLVVALVPETVPRHREVDARGQVEPMGLVSDLSANP